MPYASLESIVEQNKEAYYRALRAPQRTLGDGNDTDWEPWLGFFLLMLHRQTKALGRRVDALHQTLNQLSKAERDLLEIVETTGRVTVAQAVERIGQSRNTIRKRLAGLVAKGLLTLLRL